ncbi:MAG: nucleoside 2-deoxyribosyltransferase [Hyphomicrobiaceae bacterium]
MFRPTLYLAGPEVFLSNALEISNQKKQICTKYGFHGLFPLDGALENLTQLPIEEQSQKISEANERLITEADGVIANCTPFRGVSMDVGTGYEIGFARALGKPVFGYTNVDATYEHRANRYNATLTSDSLDPYTRDTEIERFGLFENLMIAVALRSFGAEADVVRTNVDAGRELTDLSGFETCLCQARTVFAAAFKRK